MRKPQPKPKSRKREPEAENSNDVELGFSNGETEDVDAAPDATESTHPTLPEAEIKANIGRLIRLRTNEVEWEGRIEEPNADRPSLWIARDQYGSLHIVSANVIDATATDTPSVTTPDERCAESTGDALGDDGGVAKCGLDLTTAPTTPSHLLPPKSV